MENTFELKCRRITEKDWEYLPSWWESYPVWKNQSIPREMLPGQWEAKIPDNLTEEEEKSLGISGYIVEKDGYPIAACWLTLTNSKMAMVAPVVADPLYRDNDRADAIERLIHFTTHVAYDLGYEYAHAWSTHENLTDIYKKIGYTGEPCHELTIKL